MNRCIRKMVATIAVGKGLYSRLSLGDDTTSRSIKSVRRSGLMMPMRHRPDAEDSTTSSFADHQGLAPRGSRAPIVLQSASVIALSICRAAAPDEAPDDVPVQATRMEHDFGVGGRD